MEKLKNSDKDEIKKSNKKHQLKFSKKKTESDLSTVAPENLSSTSIKIYSNESHETTEVLLLEENLSDIKLDFNPDYIIGKNLNMDEILKMISKDIKTLMIKMKEKDV